MRWATTRSSDEYRTRTAELAKEWDDIVSDVYRIDDGVALNQNQVIGLANTLSDPRDVVVCAAGSMPGDLHKLWRTRDRKGYHVEYGFSCMGYEVAGGIGAKMAEPDRDVFIMVGDGSYLMMATELVTAVQENVKVIVVLVQNHGFASIGSLSEALGSQRFGTVLPIPQRRRPARWGQAARRPRRQRGQPGRRRHPGGHRRRVHRCRQGRQGQRTDHGDPRRDRPADRRARQRILVGRTGFRDLHTGVHPGRVPDVRRLEEDPAAIPPTFRQLKDLENA